MEQWEKRLRAGAITLNLSGKWLYFYHNVQLSYSSDNKIGAEGVKSLAQCLQHNSTLTTLNLESK